MQSQKFSIDFVGVGATKSATTWIYQCLSEHPDVCPAERKEVSFFLKDNFKKGVGWYQSHFSNCEAKKIKGEFSPQYLTNKEVVLNIKNTFPETKIIACLRNPTERFISANYFFLTTGRYTKALFEEIMSNPIKNPFSKEELRRGLYYHYLKPFFNTFSKKQIHIILYEDILKSPGTVLRDLYKFLNIDTSFIAPSLHKRKNVTSLNTIRSIHLQKFIYKAHHRITFGAWGLLRKPLTLIGLNKLSRAIRKTNTRPDNETKPLRKSVSSKTKKDLINYYLDDIENLEKMISKDLSNWKL